MVQEKKAEKKKSDKPDAKKKVAKKKEDDVAVSAESVADGVPKDAKPEKKSRKKPKKSQKKVCLARGKRKESIARATIREGKGNIRINKILVSALNNKYVQDIIKEPLNYVGPQANNIDISIDITGGGMMGQAQAARTAIARALVAYFGDEKLKETFMSVDRSLLIEDTRRVEPKKYLGPKARARYQKSYR